MGREAGAVGNQAHSNLATTEIDTCRSARHQESMDLAFGGSPLGGEVFDDFVEVLRGGNGGDAGTRSVKFERRRKGRHQCFFSNTTDGYCAGGRQAAEWWS